VSLPSARLLELIASFESFRSRTYVCPGGRLTIGYGTTVYPDSGEPVKRAQECTKEQAWKWLETEVALTRDKVVSLISWQAPEQVLDACTSFAYNIGPQAFADSTALKRLNTGDVGGSAVALKWWNKATDPKDGKKRVLGGLKARRQAEADIMVNGWDGTAGGTPVGLQENRPVLVGSKGFWGSLVALVSVITAAAPMVVPIIQQEWTGIQPQLAQAQTNQERLLPILTAAMGILFAIWSKREDFRKGSFGSQGR
jgi:lysozyme